MENSVQEVSLFYNKNIIDDLQCPVCRKGQFFFFRLPRALKDGSIQCHNCGEVYQIIDGIIHFYKGRKNLSGIDYTQPDWPLREREREKRYEIEHGFSHEWLRSLPFPIIETETTFQKKGGALGKNFFDLLDRLDLCGSEYIFDMAAGCCWTSNEFSKRRCKVEVQIFGL